MIVLSRYACLRRVGPELIAEGREPGQGVTLDDAGIRLVRALAQPRELAEAAAAAGLSAEDAKPTVALLRTAGVVVDADAAAREDASLWRFDDARFHARTRCSGIGPFPAPGAPSPPPALADARWPETLELPRPDHDALERDDPPLAAVQAARRSVRDTGPAPLALADLGEFLSRVGRIEDVWQIGAMDFAARPYPAAGALYELELYVAASDCEGVPPGLYHYAADHHRLGRAGAAGELLAAAAAGMGVAHVPQALIVVSARFPRIAWKYGPLAYSLMLKNVGVVFQTMYLAATAMGLGACAVGTGDAEAFAAATGLDPEQETSIGELCLAARGASPGTASSVIIPQ
jgi:SagB-type dehydrogenase family enzyme